MLHEFATLEETNPRESQRVTQLIAHLMRDQFVHVEDRGSATLLETLFRPKLKALVEAYFDVAGYRLVHRETEGWVGILPDPERISLPRMRTDETVVLLILRRLEMSDMAERYGRSSNCWRMTPSILPCLKSIRTTSPMI